VESLSSEQQSRPIRTAIMDAGAGELPRRRWRSSRRPRRRL